MWRQGVQLNSAATVTLQGEHFVHAAIFHRFAREPEQDAGWAPRRKSLQCGPQLVMVGYGGFIKPRNYSYKML